MSGNARVVCITGMHRSGTSLIASWLRSCGLVIDLGGLMSGRPDNVRGHFEDLEIVGLHSDALRARRRRSRGWKLDSPESLTFSTTMTSAAQQLVAQRSEHYPQWGWKDPRSLAFLHQWRRIVPSLYTVVVWRSAAEVVDSLVQRSRSKDVVREVQIDPSRALKQWLFHNELALAYKAAYPASTVLLPLRAVIADDRKAFGAIVGANDVELEFKSLGDRYEPELLSSSSATRLPPRGFRRSAGRAVAEMENRLTSASDL